VTTTTSKTLAAFALLAAVAACGSTDPSALAHLLDLII